jgi:hypothetical protein
MSESLRETIREFDRQVIASDSFRHQLRLAHEEGHLDELLQDVGYHHPFSAIASQSTQKRRPWLRRLRIVAAPFLCGL